MKDLRRLLLPLAVTLWSIVMLLGFWAFHAYSNTAGGVGSVPNQLPVAATNQLASNRHRLILVAHPRCPCTSATLDELAALLEINQIPVAVEVWFVRPQGAPVGWENTSLWHAASAIPGVSVFCDEYGDMARTLGAVTSGQALLYNPDGKLLFKGGITRARGQGGDNPGRQAILDQLSGKSTNPQSPVFGCPLMTPNACIGKGEVPCRP